VFDDNRAHFSINSTPFPRLILVGLALFTLYCTGKTHAIDDSQYGPCN
jgi:hypothetical protein